MDIHPANYAEVYLNMLYQKQNPRNSDGQSISILRPYAVGRAATNLQVGQTELMVIPLEKLPFIDGEVTDHVTQVEFDGVDAKGNHYAGNVNASNAIRATWFSRDGFLKFPGLVRRGERVQIWRNGETDQYYWELLGLDNDLRRKDILLLVISSTENEQEGKLDNTNSVVIEINTVDRHLTLSTPKNRDELCAYMMQLNYGLGEFSFSDDVGNSVVLKSRDEFIQFINKSRSLVKMEKEDITMESNNSVNIKTKKFNLEAEESTSIKTKNSSLEADKHKMDADFSFNGDGSIEGGSLEHNGTNIGSTHRHGGVDTGSGSTKTPH